MGSETETPFCDVLVETHALRTFATLTGEQQRSWLRWIDEDADLRSARRCEAADRVNEGELTAPGYGLSHRARDAWAVTVGRLRDAAIRL